MAWVGGYDNNNKQQLKQQTSHPLNRTKYLHYNGNPKTRCFSVRSPFPRHWLDALVDQSTVYRMPTWFPMGPSPNTPLDF